MVTSTVLPEISKLRSELETLDRKRDTAQALLKAWEDYLDVNASASKTVKGSKKNKPVGKVSMRSAIEHVLKRSNSPLTTQQIWEEVQELGASTTSKNPRAIIDLTTYQLKNSGRPVTKVSPATWAWDAEK